MKYSRRLNYSSPEGEHNHQRRHRDFDDSVITSVYEICQKFALGQIDDKAILANRSFYDDKVDFDDDVRAERMDYDILDALDDQVRLADKYPKSSVKQVTKSDSDSNSE